MLLNEIAFTFKYRVKFATNIQTECYYMQCIDSYPELKHWLETEHGKKIFTLDEAGKHIKRMRFMTEQNLQIMDLLQLIRHYDCGFIGCAPSAKYIDSNFLNTDILDARIRKYTLTDARILDYYNHDSYFWHQIPKTSISHNSKDIAPFSMQSKKPISQESLGYQIAYDYAHGWNFDDIAKKHGKDQGTWAMRELKAWLKDSLLHITSNHVDSEVIENKTEP